MWLLLPIFRSGLSAAAITTGMLLGLSLGILMVWKAHDNSELVNISHKFLYFGEFIFLLSSPLPIIMLHFIDHQKKYNRSIETLSAVYILTATIFAIILPDPMNLLKFGLSISIILILISSLRRLTKITQKKLNPINLTVAHNQSDIE